MPRQERIKREAQVGKSVTWGSPAGLTDERQQHINTLQQMQSLIKELLRLKADTLWP